MPRLTAAQRAEIDRLENERRDVRAKRWKRAAAAVGVLVGLAASAIAIVNFFGVETVADLPGNSTEAKQTAKTLAALRAGSTLASVEQAVGTASTRTALPGSDWAYSVFVHDDYAVSAVTDAADQVVVLSVLVCDPAVKPAFTTSSGTTVTLNGPVLALAETTSNDEETTRVNDRRLYYLNSSTGRQQSSYFELTTDSERSGNDYHLYGLGYSGSCSGGFIDDLPDDYSSGEYSGSVAEAPAGAVAFRSENPPNFYTDVDTQYSLNFSIDDQGAGRFESIDDPALLVEYVPLSMHGSELPANFPQ